MDQTATEVVRKSRVGKRPLVVPKGVTVSLGDGKVDVQGPKGKLSMRVPERVLIKQDGDALQVESTAPGRDGARLQGLGRALLASMVKGAAEGYERTLELVGTGYRAEVRGKQVTLVLGFSHPTKVELPPEVAATIPPDSKGTILILSSADKAKLGQLAATIRALRPPEPYGGKGIRYRGELIRRKAGKAGKAKGAK
jgi:large subunit ribosomal protein L6